MKLFVGSGTLGLSATVPRPVGLLEAGTSGVTTSLGVVSCYFAIASDSVSFLLFVDKFTVSADHHESAFVITCVDAGLQGVVAFAEVGSQGVARYAARLVCKVKLERPHSVINVSVGIVFPVVSCNGLHGHFFFGNQGLPFIFRFEIPKRRVVGIFILENLFATFLVVAGVWIGGRSHHWFTPAWITIRTLVYVAFVIHLLWIGALSTSDGTFVIVLVERVELVMEPFPLPVDAPVHDGIVVVVVVAPQFAVQALAADGLVGTARLVAAYGNGFLGFAGDTFVDGSLSFVIVGACVFVVRALAATVVARVAGFPVTALGYFLAFFAVGDRRLEVFVFGTGLHVVDALAAVRAPFVTRYCAARAVHDDTLHAFLDNADACRAVGAGALVAVVAFDFNSVLVRAFLALCVAENAFVASGFLADASPVFCGTARCLAQVGECCFGRG